MKGFKVKEKLKKSLIVTIVTIMIAFMMPVKSKADIVNDFIDLLLRIPDGVMHVIDSYIGGSDEFTYEELEFRGGWDEGGRVYNFIVTPYDIFSSGSYEENNGEYYTKLGLLDINFFADRPIKSKTLISSEILAPVIGNVYKSLRNLAMVLMLLVVLYIGIKIMISSIAAQQAKYKQLLVDWLVGFALLFVMHYIMSGIVYLNSVVVKMLSNEEGDSYYVSFAELEDDVNTNTGSTDSTWFDVANSLANDFFWGSKKQWQTGGAKYDNFRNNRLAVRNSSSETETFSSYIDSSGRIDFNAVPKGKQSSKVSTLDVGYVGVSPAKMKTWGDNGVVYLAAKVINPGHDNSKYEDKAIVKLNTMSYVRTISSFGSEDNDSVLIYDNGGKKDMDMAGVMGYSILYLCLVIETIMFTFTYIKRVLQMAFLTMVAPIVAIMYPVDKIGDGKAQAFNTWFKDYLFNILIQPMHLLLYTIFIVAAAQLVSRNIIYALAIYGFMIPSEKYFKKILGFEKGGSAPPGPLGQAIGRGLAMDGLGRLAGIGPSGKGGPGGSGGSGNKRKKPKTKKLKDDPANGVTGPAGAGGPNGGGGTGDPNGSGVPSGVPKKTLRSSAEGIAKGLGGAIGHRADRGLKGLTGGKYRHLRDLKGANRKETALNIAGAGGAALLNGAKFAGRKIQKGATRAAGMALMGAVGVTAGAASAMATGDINNLWKGATVGIGAGNKIGGNIANRAEGFYDDFAEEVKAERAENDTAYAAQLRTEQARDAYDEFIESQSPADRDKYEEVRDRYAPFMDEVVKGDEDTLKALFELEHGSESGAFNTFTKNGDTALQMPTEDGRYRNVAIAQDASTWGSLKKSDNERDYRAHLESLFGGPCSEVEDMIKFVKIAQGKMGK